MVFVSDQVRPNEADVSRLGPIETRPADVSLVVSTIGRPPELRRLITSLDAEMQHGVSVELIVVDQSPGELTTTRQFLDDCELGFTCLYTRSSIGVSHGRNVGLSLASGDYVMFPDDDAWFSGDMLATAVNHLQANSDIDGFCARLCAADGSNSMLRWSPKAQLVTHRNHHRTSIGSVMLYRRHTALAVGGFDETMGPGADGWFGSCEDADYLLRAIEQGASIWYEPKAVIHHRDSRGDGGADAERKSLSYGCGQGHMWRSRTIGRIWVFSLMIRRLIGSIVMSLRGRREVARVQRAWVRGSINGFIGKPPLELNIPDNSGSQPETSALAPTAHEFTVSFRWRIIMSALGILATFILTAIAARNLPDLQLALFYVLLASLSISPIVSRLGINTKAVQELGATRARGDWDLAVSMARQASKVCLVPALIIGPAIGVFILASTDRSKFFTYAILASIILVTESVRLTYSDVFIGLGMPRWSASLAHQGRAIIVTGLVAVDLLFLSGTISLDRILFWGAISGTGLVVIGHIRLWTMPFEPPTSKSLSYQATIKAGLAFLMVDLVAVLIARGDVWLAAKFFDTETAAIYSTASVLAMQIFTPIGLANVALAPVAAGYLAVGRTAELQHIVQRVMSLLAAFLVPAMIFVVIYGDKLLTLAYGERFAASAPYLAILLAGNIAFVLLGMSSVILVMAGRQKMATAISLGWLAIAAPLAIAAAAVHSPVMLAVASSLATIGLVVALAMTAWVTTGVKVYPTFSALAESVRMLPQTLRLRPDRVQPRSRSAPKNLRVDRE